MGLWKKWVEAAAESNFADTDRKTVFLGGMDILLLKIDGTYYAVHNVCSHAQALMVGGLVEGFEIECPLHGARFDVRTGANLTPPADRPLAVFATRVENGRIWVRV